MGSAGTPRSHPAHPQLSCEFSVVTRRLLRLVWYFREERNILELVSKLSGIDDPEPYSIVFRLLTEVYKAPHLRPNMDTVLGAKWMLLNNKGLSREMASF